MMWHFLSPKGEALHAMAGLYLHIDGNAIQYVTGYPNKINKPFYLIKNFSYIDVLWTLCHTHRCSYLIKSKSEQTGQFNNHVQCELLFENHFVVIAAILKQFNPISVEEKTLVNSIVRWTRLKHEPSNCNGEMFKQHHQKNSGFSCIVLKLINICQYWGFNKWSKLLLYSDFCKKSEKFPLYWFTSTMPSSNFQNSTQNMKFT